MTIADADTGVSGRRVILRNSTLTNNGTGVGAYDPPFSSAVLRDTVITGSSATGVISARVRLVDSSVTGSAGACSPGDICCDLEALSSVVLRGTSTCGTSCDTFDGTPYGVCTND